MRLRFWLPFRATKKLVTLCIILIFFYSYIILKSETKDKHSINNKRKVKIAKSSSKKFSFKKTDWQNFTLNGRESKRVGIGKHGVATFLPNQDDAAILRLVKKDGHNTVLGDSDNIALRISLPDYRHALCKNRLYNIESLPNVSVIIIFHNEHLSTLLRTVHSVVNRSPEKLIQEIFLVDDASDKDKLKEQLDKYVKKKWPKVRVIRLAERSGIVGARLAGARLARADVLVFLDSHTEVNVNWLPPLLEPIALNYQTAVVPIIDYIDPTNFKYYKIDDGARGGLSFTSFLYVRIPMLPKDEENLPEPFETPIMSGKVFAISRSFFWKLGGYDPGIKIWGCENFEISFKIWQCGGRMLEAPCSRVGHLYREVTHPVAYNGFEEYFFKNLRRVADVWMDEYAKMKYQMLPKELFNKYHPGDLTEQKALRQRLKCKPFKWFMTQIAFDLLQQYPIKELMPYAEGRIHAKANPDLCIDSVSSEVGETVEIRQCYNNPNYKYQNFYFSWHNDIQIRNQSTLYARAMCIAVVQPKTGAVVKMQVCHGHGGNQQWRYYQERQQLVTASVLCLDHDPIKMELFLGVCDFNSESQKWIIDVVNSLQLEQWNPANSVWITEPVEKWKDDR